MKKETLKMSNVVIELKIIESIMFEFDRGNKYSFLKNNLELIFIGIIQAMC